MSIKRDLEYAGRLCQFVDGSCTYTKPKRGSKHKSTPGSCPTNTQNKGVYHTHGAESAGYDDANFSQSDMLFVEEETKESNGGVIINVLGTPSNDIKVYIPHIDRAGVSPLGGTVTTIGTTK